MIQKASVNKDGEIGYSRFFNPKDKIRVNRIISMQRHNDIINMLLEGKDPNKEILPYIINKYMVTVGSARVYLTEARNEIKKRNGNELHNIISLHISRYEYIYNELFNLGMHGDACNVLETKERLLGFHKEGFHMKVSQGEISQVHTQIVDSDYNISKIDKDKQARLNYLLNKARGA